MKNTIAPSVVQVYFKDRKVFFELSDGREAGCPLDWFAGLKNASEEELMGFRVSAYGVHWDSLQESLSIEGMFSYVPNIPKGKR